VVYVLRLFAYAELIRVREWVGFVLPLCSLVAFFCCFLLFERILVASVVLLGTVMVLAFF